MVMHFEKTGLFALVFVCLTLVVEKCVIEFSSALAAYATYMLIVVLITHRQFIFILV